VCPEHDDQVVDVARANPFEDRLEQDPLLDVAEAARRTGGQDDGADWICRHHLGDD
jgi:hypothetical protein